MKRLCIFTIFAAAALTACVKENAPAPVSEIEDTVDEVISFDFSVRPMDDVADADAGTDTKALVSADDLLSSGNQIKVYDVFKGTTSTAEYFNTILTSNGSAWGTEDEYKWTRTGTHNFFGWFLKDASGNNTDFTSLFGSANYSDYTLTLPAIEMTASTPQFDFLYSDVIQKNRSNGSSDPTGPISLKMKHLFTAFSLGARNESSQTVTITKVEISNLANKKSAKISFDVANGGDTNVELTTSSDAHGTSPDFSYSGRIELTPSATKNNILSAEGTANYLMWPQTTTDLENATISVEYTQNGLNKSASFNIPNAQAWVPGTLNHITVVFTNQSVKLDPPEVYISASTNNYLLFEWNFVDNATGYEISKDGGVNYSSIGNVDSYKWEGLNSDNDYTLYVRAISSDVNFDKSASASCKGRTTNSQHETLGTPKIISVDALYNSVTVTWREISSAETYQISLNDPNFNNAKEVQHATIYTFSGLTKNTEYTVYVRAKFWNGPSASDSKTFTTTDEPSYWYWDGNVGGNNNNGTLTGSHNAIFNSQNVSKLIITYYYTEKTPPSGVYFEIKNSSWVNIVDPVNVTTRSNQAQKIEIIIDENLKEKIHYNYATGDLVISTQGKVFVTHAEIR